MAQEIVKAGFTVYANLSGDTGGTMTAIGYAQSYNLNLDVQTEEVSDLADDSADWSKPEPSTKSWSIDVDSFVVLDGDAGKIYQTELLTKIKNDIKVVVELRKNIATDGYEYGYAYLTSYRQSGSAQSYHTWNATFSGWGELLTKA